MVALSDSQTSRQEEEATKCVGSPHDATDLGVALAPGAIVARYLVLEEVGRGGMGRVYRAHDPKLGREVALKLLTVAAGRLSTEGAARMLREAQAMAKLSHPNVVPVYDVEGDGADLFIAMEFVAGSTLRQWFEVSPRGWREVVSVFREAGKGLAAAHDVGLIHRDFKPGNVMVGDDGRVRVMDFGLARADAPLSSGEGREEVDVRTRATPDPEASQGEELTRAGVVMGTPSYMAPEQHGDEVPLGPPTDQYAFCVALWEGLHGRKPFVGADYRKLFAAKLAGPPRAEGADHVPPWLDRILDRGLSVDPGARWPSMQDLLAELDRDPAARRRRVLAGGVGVGLVAALAFVATSGTERPRQCEGAIDQLHGIWDEDRRGDVVDAVTATKLAYAADTAERVGTRLDAYAQEWARTHEDACRATHDGKTQSADVLDRRMACLSVARTELAAVTRMLTGAVTRSVVERATELVGGLPPLARCSDIEALLADVAPPDDPKVAELVDHVRDGLTEVHVLRRAGRVPEALEASGPLVAEARATGYLPIEARALLTRAKMEGAAGRFEEATDDSKGAYLLAVECGDDQLAADAAMNTAFVLGDRRGEVEEAHRWLDLAGALVRRVGSGKLLEAWYLNTAGNVLKAEGKADEAIAAYGQAEAIFRRQLGPTHRYVGMAIGNAGVALNESSRAKEALPLLEKALEFDAATVGPEHPDLGTGLTNLGLALYSVHRYEEALARHEQARDIFAVALGEDHPNYAATLTNMGMALISLNRLDEAQPLVERSLQIKEARLGPDHKALVPQLVNLGMLAVEQKRPEDGIAYMQRAREILIAHHGEDHPFVAMVENNLGAMHAEVGRIEEGRRWMARSIAYYETHDGTDAPSLGQPLGALGELELRAGNDALAEEIFARAQRIQVAHDAPAPEIARTRFRLAQLHDKDPARRQEARQAAQEALELLAEHGDEDDVAEIRDWLEARP
jgi:tetratricopeptide (TPR) repeat protein